MLRSVRLVFDSVGGTEKKYSQEKGNSRKFLENAFLQLLSKLSIQYQISFFYELEEKKPSV